MGICHWDAKILWEAHLSGVVFKDTATIGHQSLYLHPAELKFFQQEFQTNFPESPINPLENYKFGDYSDGFLRNFLGADSVSVIDFSSYEGADIIHDLNEPIPENLHGRFDALIDGGSLEHIFNFPIAVKNFMQLLKTGGSLFIATPANNLCGHGFYQFSPELMFRVFTPENGFELQRIILYEAAFPSVELTAHRKAYEVTDPKQARSRVGIMSKTAVTMLVEAKKISDMSPFANVPLQSDYVTVWNQTEEPPPQSGVKKALRSVFESLPSFLQTRIHGYRQKRMFSFSNKRFYKKL